MTAEERRPGARAADPRALPPAPPRAATGGLAGRVPLRGRRRPRLPPPPGDQGPGGGMTLGMIWAQARGRVIGKDNDLPWHLPEDLRHFRHTTAGDAVVMGRRQWESLPERIRPLPGRRNIVLSRNPVYEAPGAELVDCLADALDLVAGQDAWICGGAQVYEEAIEYADVLVVTEIDHDVDGDRHGPVIGPQRSEEHTSELQSRSQLVCRLLLEKTKQGQFW